ncbi:unnamed protein product [Arabis nemorensis]|uniref:Uncharacterized protein n=1 Tax=Arabis nemorensis TaxID=586526 RepID=A0A565B254_9BRAS|nr:unnamed protein product [Arabis nemorensis]
MFRVAVTDFVRAMRSIGSGTISHRSKWNRAEATRKKLIAEAAQRKRANKKREDKTYSDSTNQVLRDRKRIPTMTSPAPPKIPAISRDNPPTTPTNTEDKPPTISPTSPMISPAKSRDNPPTTPANTEDKPLTISPAKIMDACDGEEKD